MRKKEGSSTVPNIIQNTSGVSDGVSNSSRERFDSADTDIKMELNKKKIEKILEVLDQDDKREQPYHNHEILIEERLRVAQSVRASLVISEDDKLVFSDIETELTEWIDLLKKASNKHDESDCDDRGLTHEQNKWLNHFKLEGGHNPKLSRSKIDFIIKHGGIIRLDIPVTGKDDKEVMIPIATVASISSLSHTMENGAPFQSLDPRGESGLLLSEPEKKNAIDSASQYFVDYRSSVRGPLSTERLRTEKSGEKILAKLGGQLPAELENF